LECEASQEKSEGLGPLKRRETQIEGIVSNKVADIVGSGPCRQACGSVMKMHAKPWVAAAVAVLVLSGCAKKKTTARTPAPPRVGQVEMGIASWYGEPYHGRRAANGEIYDMERLTAAHRTLPFNTWVRVLNLTNNKAVDVRITDRGPFIEGRIIDLSLAAARQIEMIGPGIVQVRMTVLAPGDGVRGEGVFAVQAGVFGQQRRAERLKETLRKRYEPVVVAPRAGSRNEWQVLVGREPTEESAAALAAQVRQVSGKALVVRWDEVHP
jgi:rare lipoprotein A